MTYGVFTPAPAISWPVKAPDAYLDYGYDASADVGTDTLLSVAVSSSPSGAGELTVNTVSVSQTVASGTANTVITVWLGAGVAGRSYVVKIIGTSASRTYEWSSGITIDPVFATYPLPAPPSSGFGPPATFP